MSEPECGCEVIPNADEIGSGGVSYEIIHCPLHAAAPKMLAALQAISGDAEAQLGYLHKQGLRAPDTRYAWGDNAQLPDAYDTAGDYESDARGYWPAKWCLQIAVAEAAIAAAKEAPQGHHACANLEEAREKECEICLTRLP